MAATYFPFASPPPAGVTANHNAPRHTGPTTAAIAITLPIAIILTALRVYTKIVIIRLPGWDDVLTVVSLILSIVVCAFIIDNYNWGLGKDLWNVYITDLYPHYMRNYLILSVFYSAASAMSKVPILLLYQRIFPNRGFNIIVWALIAFITAYGITASIGNIFLCNPIKSQWTLELAFTAKCVNRSVFYLAVSGISIFVDISTWLLPIPYIYKLHMPIKQKIGVGALLVTGCFVCIVSILRLLSIIKLLHSTNSTRDTVSLGTWCVVETNLSIIGGCVPVLKKFFRRYIPFLVDLSQHDHPYTRDRSNDNSSGARSKGTLVVSKPVSSSRPSKNSSYDEDDDEEATMAAYGLRNLSPKQGNLYVGDQNMLSTNIHSSPRRSVDASSQDHIIKPESAEPDGQRLGINVDRGFHQEVLRG